MTGDKAKSFERPDPYSFEGRAEAARIKAQQSASPMVRTALEQTAVSYDQLAEQVVRFRARQQAREKYRWAMQSFLQQLPKDGEA